MAGVDIGLAPVHLGAGAGAWRQQGASEQSEVVALVRRGLFNRDDVHGRYHDIEEQRSVSDSRR